MSFPTSIVRGGFVSALCVTAYTSAIGWFMFNAERYFDGKPDSVLAPISLLTLLVLSVGVVGSLIFTRPVLMYLDGKKKEAVQLLVVTLAWLGLFTVALLITQLL